MEEKIKINTYKFSLAESSELINEVFGDEKQALDWAIDEVRENRTRMYFSPCQWEAYVNRNGEIIVKRYHH